MFGPASLRRWVQNEAMISPPTMAKAIRAAMPSLRVLLFMLWPFAKRVLCLIWEAVARLRGARVELR